MTAVIGIDLAPAWRDTSALYVLGAIVGEALDIEGRLGRLGDRVQARVQRDRAEGDGAHATVSEAFFTASLLFCVGPVACSKIGPHVSGRARTDDLRADGPPRSTAAHTVRPSPRDIETKIVRAMRAQSRTSMRHGHPSHTCHVPATGRAVIAAYGTAHSRRNVPAPASLRISERCR